MGLHPVILAGGLGTRLWPLSRESHPKQFLPLMSRRSMLQETVSRLDGLEDVAPPILVCNEKHRILLDDQIALLGKTPSAVILEPEGHNTAPALTLAALVLDSFDSLESEDPVMLVMPSDHAIKHVDAFRSVVQQGTALAEGGSMVAVGVVPTSPHTGYGYIRKGEVRDSTVTERDREASSRRTDSGPGIAPWRVAEFVEKPDEATAQKMVETGEYLWNSGIFLARASVWLEQIWRYRPDIAKTCAAATTQGQQDGYYYRPDSAIYASCPSDFVAYEILGKVLDPSPGETSARSPDCIVVPMDAGWSDVGDWNSLWDAHEKDQSGNVVKGDVDIRASRNSLVIGQHGRVAAHGLENVIVVETADAVLVADKDELQSFKSPAQWHEAKDLADGEGYGRVETPWGSYEEEGSGPRFRTRRLTLNPRAQLSFHMHHQRAEHWVVIKGSAKVTIGEEGFQIAENQSASVPMGKWHCLENTGSNPLQVFEVQTGSYLGDDDIVQAEDQEQISSISDDSA